MSSRIFPERNLVCSDSQKATRNEFRGFPQTQLSVRPERGGPCLRDRGAGCKKQGE